MKSVKNELNRMNLNDAPTILKACGAGVLEIKNMVDELLNDIADDWGNLNEILEIL